MLVKFNNINFNSLHNEMLLVCEAKVSAMKRSNFDVNKANFLNN